MDDQVIKWTKATVHVCSDSVLCLGKMQEQTKANQRWNAQLEEFQQSNSYRELFGIDGEPIEFEWHISKDLLHWRSSRRSKETCKIKTSSLKILKDGSSSCQCSMTSIGRGKDIQKSVFRIPNGSRISRRGSRENTGHSQAQVTKKKMARKLLFCIKLV